MRSRSSLLVKILGALMVALILGSVVNVVFEGQLVRDKLTEQALHLVRTDLEVLRAAYAQREASLVASLRDFTQSLDPAEVVRADRTTIIEQLARVQRNLDLGFLAVYGPAGLLASVGTPPAGALRAPRPDDPATTLLAAPDGSTVQVAVFELAPGWLVAGGSRFGDALAYRLRSQVGSDVILVFEGRVAGSTFRELSPRPPLLGAGGVLPERAGTARVDGVESLVQFAPVGRPGTTARGALGVALPDPAAALDRSLARDRVIGTAVLFVVAIVVGWLLFRALIRPLRELTKTATRIGAGELDARFEVGSHDEIAVLAGSLETMRMELRQKLEVIEQQAAALRESSKRITAATDEERARVARDLHDGIQQSLTVLRIGLGMAKEQADEDPSSVSANYEVIGEDLDRIIASLREVSQGLYPSILADRGLTSALRSYVARLPLSLKVESVPDPLPRLAPEVESSAYFLLSEAVTNALKHSGAGELVISLALDAGWLKVAVADDGRGFIPAGGFDGRGLTYMRDRVRSFGGELTITSEPGQGTEIYASFPAEPEA